MLLTRKAEFSASHICSNPQWSDAENQAVYGTNANPNGHGHNFVLEVTIEGNPDPVTGMVFDLRELKEIINEEVVDPMDHRFLNCEVAPFNDPKHRVVPTTENLAIEIWKRLDSRIGESTSGAHIPSKLKARLKNIRLFETADLYVDYAGEVI
jgi:6-pyruvoyltetrahydropterin/6-carboxytetrahydropterin synthase